MLRTATEHYRNSALTARSAAREARRVKSRGIIAVSSVVAKYQVTQAQHGARAVAAMLDEQSLDAAADALLNSAAFTTSVQMLEAMIDEAGDPGFDRLIESVIQDAGRAAEEVAVAVREDIGHVRYLDPPSCSRCTVLAGRVYRYSTGFLRHPGCDCVMIPTTLANREFVRDPVDLARRGLVTGLSKADRAAILEHDADFNHVVNVRAKSAGLQEAGRVLARNGKMTPEGIFRAAGDDREAAVEMLANNGYIDLSRPRTATSGSGSGGRIPPRVRGMLGPDTPDEFPESGGFRPPARRSEIDDFTHEDAEMVLDLTEDGHGGHRWPGAPDKTPFPRGWAEQDIVDWVRAVTDAPTRTYPHDPDNPRGPFTILGTHRGVTGVVQVRPVIGSPSSWYIATAYPEA